MDLVDNLGIPHYWAASSLNNCFFREVPHVTLLLAWTHKKMTCHSK
jgi:hypothetical protein